MGPLRSDHSDVVWDACGHILLTVWICVPGHTEAPPPQLTRSDLLQFHIQMKILFLFSVFPIHWFICGLHHNINTDRHTSIFFIFKWVKSYFIVELHAEHWTAQTLLALLSYFLLLSIQHIHTNTETYIDQNACTLAVVAYSKVSSVFLLLT